MDVLVISQTSYAQISKSHLRLMKNIHQEIWKTKNVLVLSHKCTQTSLCTLHWSCHFIQCGVCGVLKQLLERCLEDASPFIKRRKETLNNEPDTSQTQWWTSVLIICGYTTACSCMAYRDNITMFPLCPEVVWSWTGAYFLFNPIVAGARLSIMASSPPMSDPLWGGRTS